uniref:Mitochondrial import inner membrane translocase subunit n=1 Tax=Geotrypetes seraphini TaxID=260995 RepID=A0A6P8RHW5_GEOSA|nr:mitochondrial import inner membrane translocase subunit Tim10 B [Geotrypetes seraphini]
MDGDQQQLRNLRDFLLVYNKMTEICFNRCASNLNYRNLIMEEEQCLDRCAAKLIRSNHRLMAAYVEQMPTIVQRRVVDYESKTEVGQSTDDEHLQAPSPKPGSPPFSSLTI